MKRGIMSKISKAFRALGLILRQPYLLNLINDDERVKQRYVAKKFNLPEGLPTLDITNIIGEEEVIEPYSFLEGSSLPTDFALLRALCRTNQVEDYLEIGTWRGESSANVAPLVKNCVTINLSDDEMIRHGLSQAYVGMHRFFSKTLANVDHIQADSRTFDFSSLHKKFDLIFLDGDHHADSVASDTSNAFRLLRDDNSVIVWHDYGTGTETPRFEVLAGILDGCPNEAIRHLYHVSNTLCAIYTKKELKSSFIPANAAPDKHFLIKLKVIKP